MVSCIGRSKKYLINIREPGPAVVRDSLQHLPPQGVEGRVVVLYTHTHTHNTGSTLLSIKSRKQLLKYRRKFTQLRINNYQGDLMRSF
jgi:hypothetical protein